MFKYFLLLLILIAHNIFQLYSSSYKNGNLIKLLEEKKQILKKLISSQSR